MVATEQCAPRSTHPRGTSPPRDLAVALLLDHRFASLVAVRRAVDMANALGARVDVRVSVPAGTANCHPALMLSHVANVVESLHARHGFHMAVVHGSLMDAAVAVMSESQPVLVTVDPSIDAQTVTTVVEELAIPVLVARTARDGEIVAATDMRSGSFPVLAVARRYGAALGRKVSYVHNARPLPVLTSDPMAGPSTYLGMLELQNEVAAAKAARLRAFAAEPGTAHVARAGSTVEAILDLARYQDADLVVVGHRARPWWKRFLHSSVANAVVERSRRSVLVTPVASERTPTM